MSKNKAVAYYGDMDFYKGKRIHFIGVGGISMSALAVWCKSLGMIVSGSDRTYSETVASLSSRGIYAYVGSDTTTVEKADIVVYTSAVNDDDEELSFARDNRKRIYERHELLGLLSNGYREVIAVAGTHGKTTSSALIAAILKNSDKKFTAHIGGYVNDIGGNFYMNGNDILVTEACEYRGHFLSLRPSVAVILNIECDHPDCFKGIEDTTEYFAKFAEKVQNNGIIVLNKNINHAKMKICDNAHIFTVGVENGAYAEARNIIERNGVCEYDILLNGELYSRVAPSLKGRHNIVNALCAAVVANYLEIDKNVIISTIENFGGVRRRMEKTGTVNGAEVYSDYAHHPSEIRAAISTARAFTKDRLIVLFQPHTYSRTAKFFDDFVTSFKGADILGILPTYEARETAEQGKTAFELFRAININAQPAKYYKSFVEAASDVVKTARIGDTVLIAGAGDVDILSRMLPE